MQASKEVRKLASKIKAETNQRFFKTGEGSYSAHDKFLGVTNPELRKLAKKFADLSVTGIEHLLNSEFNEERALGLFILVWQFKKQPEASYKCYLKNLDQVNNWNLVDLSAYHILGAYLQDKDRGLLNKLAASTNLWHRRIAIVSTWYFIRNKDFRWTLSLAKKYLNDQHDLMHKATGWMLREVGKKDEKTLLQFLDVHHKQMPRTMLRYSIERLRDSDRKRFLTSRN